MKNNYVTIAHFRGDVYIRIEVPRLAQVDFTAACKMGAKDAADGYRTRQLKEDRIQEVL